jgi:hypothetical protein
MRALQASLAMILSALAAETAWSAPKEPDWAQLEKQFRELPMEAKRLTGPLFWLHGDESKERLEMYLEKVAESGNGCFTAESRPHKDWLGPGWFRDLDICLQAAKRLNLEMWIFDEKWWPSQMIGGKVPPEYGSKTMVAEAIAVEGPKAVREPGYGGKEFIGAVAGREAEGGIDGASLVDLAPHIRDGALAWDAPAGTWKVMKFTWRFTGARGMQQRMIAVDGASRECVDWFIRTVYQPHYDRFKDDFGKTIRGYFYDEPETPGDWGPEVMKLLAERKVDWKKALVAWKFALAGEEQVAAKYQYADAFAEAWGRTMYGGMSAWCREHKVVSMGHFMEHGNDLFSRQLCAGNLFQLQKYSDMGGIDLVCQQFYPGQKKHGLWQMAKLGSSIAHAYDKADDLAMCEMFGAYGQGITYPQMKWLTDQMQVRGINFMIPHSFNPRAPFDGDCPPYFYNGGFEPRYALYRVYADYTSRLSLLLAGGRHVAPVAVLFPGQSMHAGRAVRPDELTTALDDALFDSDWVPYDAFEEAARLEGGEVRLHKEGYRVLVVPPVEVIPHGTLAKAKAFFNQGGVVVGHGFLPSKSATLGKTAADIAALRDAVWGDAKPGLAACKTSPAGGKSYLLPEKPTPEQLQQVLAGDANVHPALEVLQGETSHWLHVLHRVKSGRDVFLVCNQNHQGVARAFRFKVTAAGEPECWDAMRNETTAAPYRRTGEKTVEIDLTLQPSESVLLVFQPQKRALPARLGDDAKPAREPVAVVRDTSVVDPEPELPGGKGKTSLAGASWIWLEANAAGAAPPGKRLFRKSVTLPADRKVKSATFVCSADNEFVLFVNGQKAGEGAEWSRPEEIDVAKLLKPGENMFAIAAVNGTDAPNPAGLIGRCEVRFESGDPLVVVTDAAWRSSDKEQAGWEKPGLDDKAWAQAKVAAPLGQGPWGNLSAGGGGRATLSPVKADIFHGTCALPAGVDLAKTRVCLEMDELAPEAGARVTVNGTIAGGFIDKPFRLDVTRLLKPGVNRVDIAPFAPKAARLAFYER